MHDGQQMLPSGYSTISSTSDNEVDSNHNNLIQQQNTFREKQIEIYKEMASQQ